MEATQIITGCGSRWFGHYNWACRFCLYSNGTFPRTLWKSKVDTWQSLQKHELEELLLPNPRGPDFKSINSSFSSEREWVAAATQHRTELPTHKKWWKLYYWTDPTPSATPCARYSKLRGNGLKRFWDILTWKEKQKRKTKWLCLSPLWNFLKSHFLREDMADTGDPQHPLPWYVKRTLKTNLSLELSPNLA